MKKEKQLQLSLASQTYNVYNEFLKAGFTTEQSFELTKLILSINASKGKK